MTRRRLFLLLLLFFLSVTLYVLSSYRKVDQLNNKKYRFSTSTENTDLISRNKTVVAIPTLGKVIGSSMTSSKGRKYCAFRGIPYAKLPVGQLRFKDPEPVDPWGILDATDNGYSCTQLPYDDTSEDCLTLNIFTHEVNPKELKPVIVYIHGGGFYAGSSSSFNPYYLLDRDVVLVTINYRLGAFGFLSTGDAEAPGNYGLLDQSLALRFVRDYIIHFGGDSKLVTIIGHSAGGASVEYHLLSPRSKGLFNGAIAQSGSSLCNWAFSKESSIENTKRLAKDLNCTRFTSKEMVDCLRNKSLSEIINSEIRNPSQIFGGFPIGYWLPRVDVERRSPFLPAEPEKMIREKRFNSVPFITGIASHEGLAFLGKKMAEFKQNYVRNIPSMCGFQFRLDRENLAKKIYNHYFVDNNNDDDATALEKMLSDCNFNKCGEDSARLFGQYDKRNPTFHFLFGQNDPNSPLVGSHSSIFAFESLLTPLTKEEDITVSKLILDLWSSFAYKGVPQSDLLSSRWNPINGTSSKAVKGYLKIQNGKAEMISDSMPFHHRLKYLNEIFV